MNHRLADRLEIPEDGVLDQGGGEKGGVTIFGILRDVGDARQDVREVDAIVLHKGVASCRMRSRSGG